MSVLNKGWIKVLRNNILPVNSNIIARQHKNFGHAREKENWVTVVWAGFLVSFFIGHFISYKGGLKRFYSAEPWTDDYKPKFNYDEDEETKNEEVKI